MVPLPVPLAVTPETNASGELAVHGHAESLAVSAKLELPPEAEGETLVGFTA